MKPSRSAVGLIALAAALAAVPVVAAADWGRNGAGPGAMLQNLDFAQIDANADGGITLEEWRAFATTRMAERRAGMVEARVAELFEGDADGDGALSRDELTARIGALADERRADRGERRAERGERRAERGERRGDGRGWGHRHDGHHGRGEGRAEGRGERARMGGGDPEQALVRAFQRIDRDGDARITQAELDAAVAWMQDRMQDRRGRNRD